MPVTTTKLSSKELQFLMEVLKDYIEDNPTFEFREKNTRARILHNAFFDLENNNVEYLELLK